MLYFVCVQVVDLKKIITRLTKNNGELLEIVKEKIQYEDIIADLEKKTSLLTDQLDKEKSTSATLNNKLLSVQKENEGLRCEAYKLVAEFLTMSLQVAVS